MFKNKPPAMGVFIYFGEFFLIRKVALIMKFAIFENSKDI